MKQILSTFVLEYLRFFAKLKLAQINPTIIGVTGSAGKSSCVAAIEAVLKQKYKVKTTGTTNSESGIPLAILNLKLNNYSVLDWLRVMFLAPFSKTEKYEILVVEMGVDELTPPKNMEYLLTIVKPKIGVLLNVYPTHTQQMGSVENIFKEKTNLISSFPPNGTAVISDCLPDIPTKAKVVKFKDDGTPIPAAIAVGKIFGLVTSHQSLATRLQLPPGRWSIFKGINGSTLIDSSYNASPVPTSLALERLKAESATLARGGLAKLNETALERAKVKRTIVVLGDMRELGDLAEKFHEEVATKAYQNADAVITVGPLCRSYFPANKKLIAQFDNWHEAGKYLQGYIKKDDVVLFKGSQNTIFLEGAVEMCLANKSDAALLCRRGPYWEKQRKTSSSFDI